MWHPPNYRAALRRNRSLAILLLTFGLTGTVAAQSTATFPAETQVAPRPSAPSTAPVAPPPPPQAPAPAAPVPSAVPPPAPPRAASAESAASSTRSPRWIPAPPAAQASRVQAPAAPGAITPHAVALSPGESQAPPGTWRPPRLPYVAGDPTPAGYRVESRHSSGLITVGATLLGISYGTSAVIAAKGDMDSGGGWLFLPVVGPFAAMLARDVNCDDEQANLTVESGKNCSDKTLSEARLLALLLVDGLVQITGASLLWVGLGSTQQELVQAKAMALVPSARAGSYRLDLVGTF